MNFESVSRLAPSEPHRVWLRAMREAGVACLRGGALLLAALLGAAPSSAADDPSRLPAQTFFRNADISGARLSPSGRWLAISSASTSKRIALAVIDLDAKEQPTIVANFAGADVRSFDWVNDDRLVFNLIDLQSGFGDQKFGPGLYSVRRDRTDLRQLIRGRTGAVEIFGLARQPLDANHRLLSIPRTGGDEVIVGQSHVDGRGEVDAVNALRLNVVTGLVTSISMGRPDYTRSWLFDPKGEPRVATTIRAGQEEVWWRGPGDTAWRSLARFPSHAPLFQPAVVDGSGQLFVTEPSTTKGTAVLKRFDLKANKPEAEAVVSTPGFDFEGSLLMDATGSRVYGVRFDTDAEDTIWFGERMKEVQKIVDARFPGHVNLLSCRRCDAPDVVLVRSYSDQDPGSYWIYRPPTGAWQPVGKVRGDIEPQAMATLDFQRIAARDGLDLPIWVTSLKTPKGAPPRPAVVLVHGGPWVRGTHWKWNRDSQFLASRGYVVIEPEFRGGTGFGKKHFESGWKHWGDTMQDDVADAVQWAVAKGLVDAKRVCIAGASYGGYATLMGLIAHPELYRCGVAWVAVSDPRLLFEPSWASDSTEESRYGLPTLLGDPKQDAAALARAAPVERAAEIKVPLLLAFGRDDRRVPLEHGTRMREALRAAGREPEWIIYDGEGHGWLKTENQVDFWERVERFLARELK